MATLLTIAGVFLLCGIAVTLAVSRIVGLRMTFGRLLAALSLAVAVSAAIASAIIAILPRASCGGDVPCEHGGLFEGGLLVLGLWLIFYSLSYITTAFLIARHQLHAQRSVGNDA